jgi:hypothetical protein
MRNMPSYRRPSPPARTWATLFPAVGGLRKVHWGLEDRGKREGVRMIYYWAVGAEQLRMLYVYPKASQENLIHQQLKTLREIVERWNDEG